MAQIHSINTHWLTLDPALVQTSLWRGDEPGEYLITVNRPDTLPEKVFVRFEGAFRPEVLFAALADHYRTQGNEEVSGLLDAILSHLAAQANEAFEESFTAPVEEPVEPEDVDNG